MKKIIYLLGCISLLFLIVSCDDDSKENTSNKLEDQQWFKDLQQPCDEDVICKIIVQKGIYNNDTVYYTILSGALCDAVYNINLHDLHGNIVKHYDYTEMNLFFDEVEYLETVYRCDE